jgi:acetyl-CoA acetyltransferase
MSLRAKTAIAGLGITRMGKNYTHPNAIGFATEAVELALADAGLKRSDLDGVLVNPGLTWGGDVMASYTLQQVMGLKNIRLTATTNLGGASAAGLVMHAAMAIDAGMASTVACLFADAPLKPPKPNSKGPGGGAAYRFARGLDAAYGLYGANSGYAMVARRHMHVYGTTSDQLGAIATAERKWANLNPMAEFYEEPLTIEDYHSSRWVAEPLHLYDCCLVSNGAVCVIVTSAERAQNLKKPPVYILGMGQGHPGDDPVDTLASGATMAGDTALRIAGIELKDIDVVEFYDCYTITVLITLEDYGFCKKGEGGPFVADGRIAPGGSLPVNTGGGQLSAYYMWGMTPLSEGVIQVRGEGGARQVPKHDLCLVSGNGGVLWTHSTLVLGASA